MFLFFFSPLHKILQILGEKAFLWSFHTLTNLLEKPTVISLNSFQNESRKTASLTGTVLFAGDLKDQLVTGLIWKTKPKKKKVFAILNS